MSFTVYVCPESGCKEQSHRFFIHHKVPAVPVETFTAEEVRGRLTSESARKAALEAFDKSPSTGFQRSFDSALAAAAADAFPEEAPSE